jgi:hypothetical protein
VPNLETSLRGKFPVVGEETWTPRTMKEDRSHARKSASVGQQRSMEYRRSSLIKEEMYSQSEQYCTLFSRLSLSIQGGCVTVCSLGPPKSRIWRVGLKNPGTRQGDLEIWLKGLIAARKEFFKGIVQEKLTGVETRLKL